MKHTLPPCRGRSKFTVPPNCSAWPSLALLGSMATDAWQPQWTFCSPLGQGAKPAALPSGRAQPIAYPTVKPSLWPPLTLGHSLWPCDLNADLGQQQPGREHSLRPTRSDTGHEPQLCPVVESNQGTAMPGHSVAEPRRQPCPASQGAHPLERGTQPQNMASGLAQ